MDNCKPNTVNRKPSLADAALLLGIFLTMLYGTGDYGLYEPHEGHFGGVGREMLQRGDFVTPHLNGAPYLNKPPLLYWMIAGCYVLFGISEGAARTAQVFVSWCGVVLVWWWARQLWGIAAGRTAAVILAISAGWYLFSHQLIIDPLLATLYLACVYLLWHCSQEPLSLKRWAVLYVAVGLMILAKGLVGVGLLALVGVGFTLWRRDATLLKRCRPWLGALIVGAICIPWVYLMETRNPGYLRYVLVNEHVKRAMDTRWPPDYSVVKVSIPAFIAVTLIWLAPWSLLLPQVASFGYKQGRAGAGPEASPPDRDAVALLLLAATMPVVLFLPMGSRLIYYSLPVLPSFAILAAGWWVHSADDCYGRGRKFGAGTLLIVGAVIFSAAFWVPGLLKGIPDLQAASDTLQFIPRLAVVLGIAFLTGGMLLLIRRPGLAIAALGLALGLAGAYNTAGFAAFDPVRSSKRLVMQLDPVLGNDTVWVSEGSKEIGASAGIAYYLSPTLEGKPRQVLVMADDDRRPPPAFPDPQPNYLLRQPDLQRLWQDDRPMVFITDFQRTDWESDSPRLPTQQCYRVTLPNTGHRRIYVNRTAWNRLQNVYPGKNFSQE